jgi:hypothetical protein
MSIVSNASSSGISAEPDPNLLDRLVDNEDALSTVSDLSIPSEDRYRDEFYVPDVSDKNWTYGDLGKMAEQTSASFLPDHGCSTHLHQHSIILDSILFSGSGVLDSASGVDANNFWEAHDSFDQFLKNSEFRQSSKPEDTISPGSKLQARTIEQPFPRRPSSMLMPKSKACAGFLKRILKRAKSVRS